MFFARLCRAMFLYKIILDIDIICIYSLSVGDKGRNKNFKKKENVHIIFEEILKERGKTFNQFSNSDLDKVLQTFAERNHWFYRSKPKY